MTATNPFADPLRYERRVPECSIVIFGATFELPIAVILLGLLGIVSSRFLRARRKGIWVGIIFVALVVTPGADPFTPTALLIPLIALFEASILILDKVLKR